MPSPTSNNRKLLMVGMSSITYHIGNKVRKECHVLPEDPDITQQNFNVCNTKADVYRILGTHSRIARYLLIGPSKEYVELEFYRNGTLKKHIQENKSDIITA